MYRTRSFKCQRVGQKVMRMGVETPRWVYGIKSLVLWERRRPRRKADITASSGTGDRKGGDEQQED